MTPPVTPEITPDMAAKSAVRMTRRGLLDALTAAGLAVYGGREAAAVARLVAERRYGLLRADVALSPHAEIAVGEGFEELLAEIAAARPVQYILGVADFCGMELAVGEGVLIPRPETEELVRWIVDDLKAAAQGVAPMPGAVSARTHAKTGADAQTGAHTLTVTDANALALAHASFAPRILDVGTGSGAIALALAREVAGARVTAIDLSDKALHYARLNNERTGAGVTILKDDALDLGAYGILPDGVSDSALNLGAWDVIVSNPPYIPASERAEMDANVVGYEPASALFVPDADPLVFYRAISKFTRHALSPGGALYFEIHEGAAETMPRMLAEEGFSEVEVRRDINEKPRMVKAVII